MANPIDKIPTKSFLGASVLKQFAPSTKVNEIIDEVNDIIDGTTSLTEVEVGNGTVAAPSMTFTSDSDTGIYRIGANNLGVAAAGAKVLDVSATGLEVTGVISGTATTASTTKDTGALIIQGGVGIEKEIYAGLSINAGTYLTSGNGTVSLPAIGPVSDPDSGLYVIGANNLGMALAGAKVLDMATTGLGVTGVVNATSASATSLAVGLAGATNPAFVVDSSTASQAAGLKVTGAVAAGTVAAAVISSGADANLTVNAKGTGTIGIGSVSTGIVTITPATTVTGIITPTGGITAAADQTISPRNIHVGGTSAMLAADGNDSTPVNTETYIGEVFIPANCTITGVAVFNGSNVTDNVIVALANSGGTVVAQSISTAGSGTDAYQRVPFTGTYAAKGPATYYVLTQYAGSTSRYNTFASGNFGASKKTGEVFGTFTTITPPTTFTTALANIASLY